MFTMLKEFSKHIGKNLLIHFLNIHLALLPPILAKAEDPSYGDENYNSESNDTYQNTSSYNSAQYEGTGLNTYVEDCKGMEGRYWDYDLNLCAVDNEALELNETMAECNDDPLTVFGDNPPAECLSEENSDNSDLCKLLGCPDELTSAEQNSCLVQACVEYKTVTEQSAQCQYIPKDPDKPDGVKKWVCLPSSMPFMDSIKGWEAGINPGQLGAYQEYCKEEYKAEQDSGSDLGKMSESTYMLNCNRNMVFLIFATLFLITMGLAAVTKHAAAQCGHLPSAWLLGIASLGLVAGEVTTWILLTQDLSKLREDYMGQEEGADFIGLQTKAFEAMSKSYEIKAKYENARVIMYSIAIALSALAIGFAVYEIYIMANQCTLASTKDKTDDALGKWATFVGLQGVPNTEITRTMLISPISRIIMSGTILGLSSAMLSVAVTAEKISKERKELIDYLKEKLENTQSLLYCEDRNDYGQPECYCYNEDGTENEDRKDYDTCVALREGSRPPEMPEATDYNASNTGNNERMFCVDNNNEIDEKCECRNKKDVNGVNACKKTDVVGAIANLGGVAQRLGKGADIINEQILSGASPYRNEVSSPGALRMATKAKKFAQQMLNQTNSKLLSEGKDQIQVSKDQLLALARKTAANLTKQDFKNMMRKGFPTPNKISAPLTPSTDALKKALADKNNKGISLGSTLKYESNRGIPTMMAKKKDKGLSFFGQDSGAKTGGGVVDDSFAKKSYKYNRGNDIVKRSDQSIWQIISKRYNLSAYKRLFDE